MSAALADRTRSERRRWIALAILCLGQLMMVLDATIVNVALPSIQHDLHFTQGNLTWVINGYLITFGGFLLLAGRIGDLIGRKRVFLAGLVIFTAASILCGVASSQAMLIAARPSSASAWLRRRAPGSMIVQPSRSPAAEAR